MTFQVVSSSMALAYVQSLNGQDQPEYIRLTCPSMTTFYHSLQAQSFINRICALHHDQSSLDAWCIQDMLEDILEEAKRDEYRFRTTISGIKQTDLENLDPMCGLVDHFASPECLRIIYPRPIQRHSDLRSKTMFPTLASERRAGGSASTVKTLADFKANWSVFSEDVLSSIDWSNVVVAGGSVNACLLPVGQIYQHSRTALQDYYHTIMYPDSDVDLFIYGLNDEQVPLHCLSFKHLSKS
jgi:hypothetical protein